MNPAYLSVIALLLVMGASFGTRLNVGVLAVALAWLVAVFGAGWKADAVMAVFPSSLFVTLLGVTLLFGVMQANGTMGALTQRAIRACGGRAGWLPAAAVRPRLHVEHDGAGRRRRDRVARAGGDGGRCASGTVAVPDRTDARQWRQRGQSVSVQRRRRDRLGWHDQAGVGGHEWQAWAANFVAHALAAALAWALFGGRRLLRDAVTWTRGRSPHWRAITGRQWPWAWPGLSPSCS